MRMRVLNLIGLMAAISPLAAAEAPRGAAGNWAFYGGDAGGSRYSQLDQINKANVAELKPAWELHTGDVSDGSDGRPKSEFEATPIVVAGTMFLSTPFNRVLALDPETGQEKWSFDPKIDLHVHYSEGLVNRGVAFWSGPGPTTAPAISAFSWRRSTRACLRSMPRPASPAPALAPAGRSTSSRASPTSTRRGEYEETSAPAVIDDLVIVGSSIADNDRVDSPDGAVRAFDARTGALRWSWHPIAGDAGADRRRQCVVDHLGRCASAAWCFCRPAAPVPDYHGFKRPGDNKWANSVVALSATTGRTGVGISARSSRSLGLRYRRAACARRAAPRWRRNAGRDPGQQDRQPLRAESRDRKAGLRGRRTRGPEKRRRGRGCVADAAVPALAAAARGAAADRKRRLGHQSRRAGSLPRAAGKAADRRNLHAAQRAGHRRLSRQPWRHELEQRRLRPEAADLRHQHQQSSDGSSPDPARPVPADRKRRPAGRVAGGSVAATRYTLRHEPRGASLAARDCPATRRRGASWSPSISPTDPFDGACRSARPPTWRKTPPM